jgi:hypothetical protein
VEAVPADEIEENLTEQPGNLTPLDGRTFNVGIRVDL